MKKLSRKGKLVRNCALVAVGLFLMAYRWDFPCWSKEALVKRVQRSYLLSGPAEILMETERGRYWNQYLYVRSGEGMLRISCSPTLFGVRLWGSTLYPDHDYMLIKDQEKDWYKWTVIGALEEIGAMELDYTASNSEDGVSVTLEMEGTRVDEHTFHFVVTREEKEEELTLLWEHPFNKKSSTVRFFDEWGALLCEETIDGYAFLLEGGKLP